MSLVHVMSDEPQSHIVRRVKVGCIGTARIKERYRYTSKTKVSESTRERKREINNSEADRERSLN